MFTARRRQSWGFTLLELLVTVAIIILIAGIVIASMPGVLKAMKRQETKALLSRIEDGLNTFRSEKGYYPMHPDPAIPGDGVYPDEVAADGAAVLYRALSGDYDMDGEVDPGAFPFVDRLPSAATPDGFVAVDPFGAPLRYLAEKPNMLFRERRTRNRDYDLWSLGGASDFNDLSKRLIP